MNSAIIVTLLVVVFGVLSWFALFGLLIYMIIHLNKFQAEVTGNFINLSNSLNELQVQRILGDNEDGLDGRPVLFRSIDGRYAAESMPGLIRQMLDDPNSELSDEQKENLKKFFEDMGGNEDEDGPQEPWKRQ